MPIREAVERVAAAWLFTDEDVPGTTGNWGPLSWLKRTVPPGDGFLFLMTAIAAFSTASGKFFAMFFAEVPRGARVMLSLGNSCQAFWALLLSSFDV